jgi:beta-glucosidase-like glycosyl hydrolase
MLQVNGVPACANSFLMQQILRDTWGFDGFVISDYDSVYDAVESHHFFDNFEEASACELFFSLIRFSLPYCWV